MGRFVKSGADHVSRDVLRDAQDDALVERARTGDSDSFALLYYRYKLDVWNLAYFKLHDHHEAEDTLQETFLKAYRALGQYRRRDSLRPWLLAICRNVCMDRLRVAGSRRPTVSLEDDAVTELAARATDPDFEIDFRAALAALAPEDREAFFLVDVLGCRSEEAARIVGVRAASTMRSRVQKARRTLSDDPVAVSL